MDGIESVCLKHELSENGSERCDCPLRERDALRIIESLNLNTFESVLYTFEEFLSNISLFEGPHAKNFSNAARALDIAALGFAAIDANHDFLITKSELEQYIAAGHDQDSLGWLLAKFNALQRISFFLDGITLAEIESARDLFHGLNFCKSNFDDFSLPQSDHGQGNLSRTKILAYLDKNRGSLEPHDERGLNGLIDYIERVNSIVAGK